MFYGDSIEDTRKMFYQSWAKFIQNQPLSTLEQQLVDVIKLHPEYHPLLKHEDTLMSQYLPEMGESNPFLHMGLHLAIREQINTDRPQGIVGIYQKLLKKERELHDAEHKIMNCLAEFLWEIQRENKMPDEQAYLDKIKAL